MIQKIDHDGKEHLYLFFGHGTIEVMTGRPEEDGDYENSPTDVIFGMVKEPHPIGQEIEEHDCTTELIQPVVLRFTKAESIDVVIGALEKVKKTLIAEVRQ